MTGTWRPTADELAAIEHEGSSVRGRARRYGRSQTSMFTLLHSYGIQLQPDGWPPNTPRRRSLTVPRSRPTSLRRCPARRTRA